MSISAFLNAPVLTSYKENRSSHHTQFTKKPALCTSSTPPSTPASSPRSTSVPTSSPHQPLPAGLIAKPGPTGTLCANLHPIPILGFYGWFLNVYRRNLPSKHGPFTLQIPADKSSIILSFSSDRQTPPAQKSFKGIPQGNLNVTRFLKQLSTTPADHQLRFYDSPHRELFFQRKNDITLHPVPAPSPPWHDPAPTFATVAQTSSFEVRALYPGAGSTPRLVSKFEWFSMSLFPIFPLADYSAFVCVWRQLPNMASVAIDRRGPSLRLSWFDPLELPKDVDPPERYAAFAVKVFLGTVRDEVAEQQHRMLLDAIRASPSYTAVSQEDFRIVVDNRPGVFAPQRRNEIWVQVE